jgi:hypothetical protein
MAAGLKGLFSVTDPFKRSSLLCSTTYRRFIPVRDLRTLSFFQETSLTYADRSIDGGLAPSQIPKQRAWSSLFVAAEETISALPSPLSRHQFDKTTPRPL